MLGFLLVLALSFGQAHIPKNSQNTAPAFRRTENRVQLTNQEASQFRAQAERGDVAAQLKLARAYERGDGFPVDLQQAAEWYKRASEQGNSEAQDSLGNMYLAGHGVDQNKQLAVKWFKSSARLGNADAMYSLGVAYYNGDGVDIDDELSYAWFMLSKENGNERAGEAVKRAESELKTWKVTQTFKIVAGMYEKGEDLPLNQTEATRWWIRAARTGDREAQAAVGMRMVLGRGVAQDFAQGRYFCEQASKQGDGTGEYCLGYIEQHGLGVKPNAKDARKYYERATALGSREGVAALAQMEATGDGGKQDRPAACILLLLLISKGDQAALRDLAELKTKMDSKEWEKVRKQLPNLHVDSAKVEAALEKSRSQ